MVKPDKLATHCTQDTRPRKNERKNTTHYVLDTTIINKF